MKKYKEEKQHRYKGYDYSRAGFYFVTICCKNREMFFGEVKDENMELSDIGLVAEKIWKEIPNIFPMVVLDEYIFMPDHVHGIIIINRRNAPRRVPTTPAPTTITVPTKIGPLVKNSLSSIINHYKGGVKKFCNKNNLENFSWQSRFHDRIIRDDKELNLIRKYIIENPLKWTLDRN